MLKITVIFVKFYTNLQIGGGGLERMETDKNGIQTQTSFKGRKREGKERCKNGFLKATTKPK